jgi:hypothetical protein
MGKASAHAKARAQSVASPIAAPALDSAPWYIKLAVWLLMWFGFPTLMCIVFLGLIVGYIPSPLTAVQNKMERHEREMEKVLTYVDTNTRVVRQICRNTSSNPAERVECDR